MKVLAAWLAATAVIAGWLAYATGTEDLTDLVAGSAIVAAIIVGAAASLVGGK